MHKLIRLMLYVAACLFAVGAAAAPPSATAVSLDVFVNRSCAVERLDAHELEALFTRMQTRWDNGAPVIPFSFAAGSDARVLFDRSVLRLGPDEVGRFWLDRRIRGLGLPPKQVPSAALMQQVVANLTGAIGYAPSQPTRAGVKVVARIQHGKVVPP
jgi:ABC-type phosphate transport system substrate-binding protein